MDELAQLSEQSSAASKSSPKAETKNYTDGSGSELDNHRGLYYKESYAGNSGST